MHARYLRILSFAGEGDKEENKKERKMPFQKENFGCCFGSYYDKRKQWKDTGLGEIGSALVKNIPILTRNYGYSSLSRFIEDLDNFELKRNHTSIQVILKKNDAKEVEQFMVDTVKKGGRHRN